MILLLQQRGTLTAETLAHELEVSVRTVYRDVTALSAAGIPVYATHGPGGGIGLVDDYRTSLTGLSREQARALFLFTMPQAAVALGVASELQSALLKLTAALPAGLQADPEQVRQRIFINLDQHISMEGIDRRLADLYKAIWQDRWVAVRYQSVLRDRVPLLMRRVMALGLAAQASEWFLVCQESQARFVIPVARIVEVSICDKMFDRPGDFDLSAFWQHWSKEHATRRIRFQVRLRASEAASRILLTYYPGEPGAHQGDGWQELTMQFKHLEEARQALLSLGSAVEVLDPFALRLSLEDYARQILSVYADQKT
jgi:predicted DNA-binding transcriptional regulator YafY